MIHTITIQNLKCGGCAHTVRTKLESIPNITDVNVEVESSKVSFTYLIDSDIIEAEAKLKQLGYPKVGDDNSGLSKAKSYVSCAIGKVQSK